MRTACATHSRLMTGSMPGIAASTSDTCELGSPPNSVDAPEKSLARDVTWAWTSSPTITSQSPVALLMNLASAFCAVMAPSLPLCHGVARGGCAISRSSWAVAQSMMAVHSAAARSGARPALSAAASTRSITSCLRSGTCAATPTAGFNAAARPT